MPSAQSSNLGKSLDALFENRNCNVSSTLGTCKIATLMTARGGISGEV